MISVRLTSTQGTIQELETVRCWCEQQAEYTLELVNARVGTGRFQRCRQHARHDLDTGDFKVVEAWI